MKHIAVEKGLSNISDFLLDNGYKVNEIDIRQKNSKDFMDGFDAVILSGMDNDFMGIEDTSTKAPIIIASGLSPQDIKARIDSVEM